MITRREFCRKAAAVTLGTAGASGVVAADHYDRQPEHVTLSYERDVLKKYQPKLVIDHLGVQPEAMYGWVARSEAHETFVCCYFTVYTHQESAWYIPTGGDAHFGDHEPVQIEVDEDTGDPERVRASIYHWQKEETHANRVPMDDSGNRPLLYAFKPHHHYRAAAPDESAVDIQLEDLTSVFADWLEGKTSGDGLEDELKTSAMTNPWTMQTESSFWHNDIGSFSKTAAYVSVMRTTGLGGEVGSLETQYD